MEMRLFWTELQVSIAVVVILMLRPGMKKLPKVYSYVLWLMVFGRLLCPVTFESRIGILPSAEKGSAWVEQMIYARTENDSPYRAEKLFFGEELFSGKHDAADGEADALWNSDASPVSGPGDAGEPDGEEGIGTLENGGIPEHSFWERGLGTACLALWFLGVAVILGRNGAALARLRSGLCGARLLQENVYVSKAVSVPFTLGILRPRIYLPEQMEEGETAYILCHERVHIRRKDYLVKNAAFLLTALNWFNPFVWAAFHFLESDMEMSCDEKVVELMGDGFRQRYAQSLLDFARGKGRLAATPLTFGENNVKQRVKNILSDKTVKKWGIIAGAAVPLAVGFTLFTTGAGKEPERSIGEIYWSEEAQVYEKGGAAKSVTVQAGEGGVFVLEDGGYKCLYPYDVNPEAGRCIEDGILYFMADSRGLAKGEGYREDVVCMLDLVTGEYDRETLCLDAETAQAAPFWGIDVGDGFVFLHGEEKDCQIPLVNTGNTALSTGHRWKDKAVRGLDSREADAYGAAVREQLLANPGMLMLLSNRTSEETFVIVDLDGNGRAERITLSRNPDAPLDEYRPYDWYRLRAEENAASGSAKNGSAENGGMEDGGAEDGGAEDGRTGMADRAAKTADGRTDTEDGSAGPADGLNGKIDGLKNDIWAFSPDGRRIVLALCGEGDGADDPSTYLFTYAGGVLRRAGCLPGDIRYITIEDGILEGTKTIYDVMLPLYLKVKMRINEAGELEELVQDVYDFTYDRDADLLVSLPVHSTPGGGEAHYMNAQSVRLRKVDSTFRWIYLEGEDGDSGWFAVDGVKGDRITELEMDSSEVFMLYYAG